MKLAIHNEVAVSNDEVRQLDRAFVFHSWSMQGNLNPLVIAGAQGCELWDYEGNTWLDFSSQLVNVNIGYQHPRVLAAMKAQLETTGHHRARHRQPCPRRSGEAHRRPGAGGLQ